MKTGIINPVVKLGDKVIFGMNADEFNIYKGVVIRPRKLEVRMNKMSARKAKFDIADENCIDWIKVI